MLQFNQTLRLFFLLTYVLILILAAGTIEFNAIYLENKLTFIFLCCAFLMYGLFYLTPALVITLVTRYILKAKLPAAWVRKIIYAVAILFTAATTLVFYANAKLYALYGMYINGFILNLLFTPGGIESLGGSQASDIGFAAIALGFLLLQVALLYLAVWLTNQPLATQLNVALQKLRGWRFTVAAILSVCSLHMAYAYDLYNAHNLSPAASAIPFYQHVSSRGIFKVMGIKGTRSSGLKAKGKLNYPLNTLSINKPTKPYNVIWLVSESWRADMLDAHVMPNTWAFAKQATRFTNNYSSGNGTRAAVFSLLMGMPASYWFQFLQEQRGAAILDVMRQQQYQMQFYTSAKFSYPEFDKTIFAQVPQHEMHANNNTSSGWEADRDNVSKMLSFVENRDTAKPFFTFMFFESPHARYYFPPEAVIAKPYRDDLNYASLSKETIRADIVPIKNRYINAVHHLDMQFGRVFNYLTQHHLLENTIVVVVGDHGEEFMEHGFWGHNSTFVDEQVRTPLVIYAPKHAANVVNALTSHADIVPTLMPMLGVTNPKADYSIGINLFNGETRNHAYIADWDSLAYVDAEVKIIHPVNSNSVFKQKLTTAQDQPLTGEAANAMLAKKSATTMQIMRDLTHFKQANASKVRP